MSCNSKYKKSKTISPRQQKKRELIYASTLVNSKGKDISSNRTKKKLATNQF